MHPKSEGECPKVNPQALAARLQRPHHAVPGIHRCQYANPVFEFKRRKKCVPADFAAASNIGASVSHAPSGKHALEQGPVTPKQAGQVQVMLRADKMLSNLSARQHAYIRAHPLQATSTAVNEPRDIQIEIHIDILFDTGSDWLRPIAQGILLGLVPFLDAVQNRIQVNGYSGSAPIHTTQFPSNWFLSVGRELCRTVSRGAWCGSNTVVGTGLEQVPSDREQQNGKCMR